MKKAWFQKILFSILLAFSGAMAVEAGRALAMSFVAFRSYVEQDCTVVRNGLVRTPDSERLDLVYRYSHEGRTYESTRYQWGLDFFADLPRENARAFVRRHPPGSQLGCWIDPRDPRRSVIERASPWRWYELAAVAALFSVSLYGFWLAFFRPDKAERFFVPSDPS